MSRTGIVLAVTLLFCTMPDPLFCEVSIHRTAGSAPLITNLLPEGVTGEAFSVPEDREYFFISPLEQTSPAGDSMRRLVYEAIQEVSSIDEKKVAEEVASDEEAVIGDARLGTRVTDGETGLSMLVPQGWKEKKSADCTFSFSAVHGEDGLSEFVEISRLKRQQGASVKEKALQTADMLTRSRLTGGIRDFDIQIQHPQGTGWKVSIRRIGAETARMGALLAIVEEPPRQGIDEPGYCQALFVFGEKRLVNYNVIFDAMVESMFFGRPGAKSAGL